MGETDHFVQFDHMLPIITKILDQLALYLVVVEKLGENCNGIIYYISAKIKRHLPENFFFKNWYT
jgi:hypothetical protein